MSTTKQTTDAPSAESTVNLLLKLNMSMARALEEMLLHSCANSRALQEILDQVSPNHTPQQPNESVANGVSLDSNANIIRFPGQMQFEFCEGEV